jgi:6-phosphogluconolactonase
MKPGKLKGFYIYETPEALFRSASRVFLELCNEEITRKGFFTVVLSGGSTPLGLYRMLVSDEFRELVPWKDVFFFWGDERCVAPDSPESNYGAAYRTFLSKAAVPAENVHRMRGEGPPEEAAREYEAEIRGFFRDKGEGEMPVFDFILFGLGSDGHTLSLFPGSPALSEDKRLVVDVYVEELGAWRLTMTLPLVNNARAGAFLVTGIGKAGIIEEMMQGEAAERYPAQMIKPDSGNLIWFVDREAASGVVLDQDV